MSKLNDNISVLDDKSFLENDLPEYLQHSIEKMKIAWILKISDPSYTCWEGDYYDLQNDINVAEAGKMISEEQAWYLREKYLGLSKENNSGNPI